MNNSFTVAKHLSSSIHSQQVSMWTLAVMQQIQKADNFRDVSFFIEARDSIFEDNNRSKPSFPLSLSLSDLM
jgi:hypothetical protein